MRPLSRFAMIAIREESCRFALQALGEGASKAEMLEWIAFFDRVQLEGAMALDGVYAAPTVTPLRVLK